MKFKDLTQFDLDLIKSLARQEYIDKANVDASTALIESVFNCINAKGMMIVRDETREATWSEPKASWYTKPAKRNEY